MGQVVAFDSRTPFPKRGAAVRPVRSIDAFRSKFRAMTGACASLLRDYRPGAPMSTVGAWAAVNDLFAESPRFARYLQHASDIDAIRRVIGVNRQLAFLAADIERLPRDATFLGEIARRFESVCDDIDSILDGVAAISKPAS